ncbi:33 kDa chaperonin [Desulfosarcina alkanivorans]|uniref:33 kDa chaperonin n=1 Tax=Desulfosarcina alkanivorans TaxID=571177 RepID=A0A5K7YC40_9BACT|nr:Hsp33 family molecular chaperone HslO [Desulfosarcina alkanivorans]BBO66982.1 33 kDa chaperonin [Desulfosarcina alkanivorans]
MKKTQPENSRSSLKDVETDRLHAFLMAGDTIRGAILNGTRMVNRMRRRHRLGILETLVLGHAYLGACLMSAGLKGRDRLSLQVDCSGPVKGLVVEANAAGEVRGFLKQVPIPVEKPLQDFNLSPFFGAGFLSVTRTLADAKQPFTGKVMMAHGSLAKDLAHYYLTSEQIPTSFSLSVKFDNQGNMDAAGGLFLQAMPDADEDVVRRIEEQVVGLPSIGDILARGTAPEQFIRNHLGDHSPRFIDRREVGFVCHCSRDQIRNVLTLLPIDELKDIREKGPFPIEICCHHCNTRYAFDRQHIDLIVAARFSEN